MVIRGETPDYISASVAHVRTFSLPFLVAKRVCSAGLQAAESLHHSPESHAVHCQGFLEDGLRQEVWSDSDAV